MEHRNTRSCHTEFLRFNADSSAHLPSIQGLVGNNPASCDGHVTGFINERWARDIDSRKQGREVQGMHVTEILK